MLARRGLLALPLPGLARAQGTPIRVGSKNFAEQLIVGELWAQALESAGLRVQRRLNLGGTQLAQAALRAGEIDLYPEYTGTGLGLVLGEPTDGDMAAVFRRVATGYEARFGLRWIAPSRIDNGNAMLMRPERAAALGLRTLVDLAAAAPALTLAAGNEFADRFDGLPGLARVYGIRFRRLRQFAALGLRYAALRHGQADVVNGYATDWQIAAGGFASLVDDRGLWPPYQLAALVRPEALAAAPQLEAVLGAINARLDNATMQAMNRAVDGDGEEPREVAARFLRG